MFRNEFKFSQDLLSEGHKLATKSIIFFGSFLVVLAGLIFMFPAMIGTLFAIFMLLAGLVVLAAGYYFWQTKTDKNYNLNSLETKFNFTRSHHNKPRYYHFQKTRFKRW